MELGVLAEQGVTERRAQLGLAASATDEPERDAARVVDPTLHLPALRELAEVAGVGGRESRGGDVQEAVEVDAQRAVHEPADQLGSRRRARAPGAARSPR